MSQGVEIFGSWSYSKDQGTKGIQYLSFYSVLCHQVPATVSSGPTFSTAFLLLLINSWKPFLCFTSLSRFNARLALAFLTPSLQCLCVPPGLLLFPCFHPFYVWILSGAPCSFKEAPCSGLLAQLPTCRAGPLLGLEKMIFENWPSLMDPSSLQGHIPWGSAEFGSPEISWTFPSLTNPSMFVSVRSIWAPLLVGSLLIFLRNLSSMHSPRHCSCLVVVLH